MLLPLLAFFAKLHGPTNDFLQGLILIFLCFHPNGMDLKYICYHYTHFHILSGVKAELQRFNVQVVGLQV